MGYRGQTSFISSIKCHGDVRGKRKTARPIATKRPMHVILKSSKTVGKFSMFRKAKEIEKIVSGKAKKNFVQVRQYSNNGNHLHLLVQAKDRELFKNFLMAVSGRIAQLMTGSTKGRPQRQKFWDHIPFTRIVEWGKDLQNVTNYVVQNFLEGIGWIPYQKRGRPKPA